MTRRFLTSALLATLAVPTGPASLAQTPPSPRQPASAGQWRRDVEQIVRDLRANHPNPFAKVGELTFLREAESLIGSLGSLSEEQRVVRAMRLVAMLGDGHTTLEPINPALGAWYPIRLYDFTDGFFITSAHRSIADLAGAQVLEIAGEPVARVVNEARRLMGADNSLDSKEKLFAVHNAGLMRGLGYAAANGELRVKLRLRDGKTVDRTLVPKKTDAQGYRPDDSSMDWRFRAETLGPALGTFDDWISAYRGLPGSAFRTADPSRPPHFTQRRVFVARSIPESDAYYIQVNAVSNMPDESFGAFFRRALGEVDRLKPRRLIVDLRYNYGGDGSILADMTREFAARAASKPWRELYVLSGRRTFSAGVMTLDAFLDHTDASIVGEAAGAPLNSYGDANTFDYPSTGLRMYASIERHQLGKSTDLSAYVPVDVAAPFSFADYAAGRDPAVDPILRGDEMRSIPTIAMTDGGAAARRAYQDRKTRFASYEWWSPPSEISLRRVALGLIEQKKIAEAIEVARLNTEINPGEWRTWYNLGNAQTAAGQRKEALESYRRCLALDDPTNFNAERLRALIAEAEKQPT